MEKDAIDVKLHPSPSDDNLEAILEAERQNYEKNKSPISLIGAFQTAYRYGRPIPEWVLDHLHKIFLQHSTSKGDVSLDKLFGFTKGKGQAPAYVANARRNRDFFTMWTIYRLKTSFHMSTLDAATIVRQLLFAAKKPDSDWLILSPEQMTKKYTEEKWKNEFQGLPAYEHTLAGLIEAYGDDRLKTKYKKRIEERLKAAV